MTALADDLATVPAWHVRGLLTVTCQPGTVLDLFAGPGGWDIAAHMLGLAPSGLERDATACATRILAGLATTQCDVTRYPAGLAGKLWGLIGSPPCTTFSQSGTRAALRLTAIIAEAIRDTFAGRDTLAVHLAAMAAILAGGGMEAAAAWQAAASALLMAEPARFIRAGEPEWIALEQVPGARPLYELYAAELAARGYHVWCGVLNAADYGVPQARRRVVLIASKTRHVGRPAPTHFDAAAGGQLFGQPRVPMATVVGFGPDRAPSPAITGGGVATGGAEVYAPGSRRALAREYAAGRWLAGGPNEFGYVRDAAAGKVQLTPAGCAALQGFPYAYPWQGGKGRQHLQIGNAVPPGLARRVIAEATGIAA